MDERAFQEELMPRVLRLDAAAPDPNLVAAYVDGTLPPDERRRLARQIEVDPEAMLLVRALRADRRRAVVRRALMAAAAVLVAAVGVGTSLKGRASTAGTLEERLVAASDRLRERAPDLFRGFAPLGAADLEPRPPLPRGGGAVTWPVGLLLEAPREVRWRLPAGASRVEVGIAGDGVDWSAEAQGERAPAPPLGPGRYAIRVRALDALAGQEVRASFVVATEAEAGTHRRALERIRADAPPDVADLLAAHYAIRHGMFPQARRAAEAARAQRDARAMAEALLRHLDSVAPESR